MPTVGSLYGIYTFIEKNGARLAMTTTPDARIAWKTFNEQYASTSPVLFCKLVPTRACRMILVLVEDLDAAEHGAALQFLDLAYAALVGLQLWWREHLVR